MVLSKRQEITSNSKVRKIVVDLQRSDATEDFRLLDWNNFEPNRFSKIIEEIQTESVVALHISYCRNLDNDPEIIVANDW